MNLQLSCLSTENLEIKYLLNVRAFSLYLLTLFKVDYGKLFQIGAKLPFSCLKVWVQCFAYPFVSLFYYGMYTLLSFSETFFYIFISLGLFLESGRHFLKAGRFLMQRGEQWTILERGRRTQKKVRYEFFGTDLLPQQKQESNSEAVIRQKDGCRLPRRLPNRYDSKESQKKKIQRAPCAQTLAPT